MAYVSGGRRRPSSMASTKPRRSKLAATEIGSALFDAGGKLKLGRKHRPDYILVVLIAAIALTGLVVLFSISPASVETINTGGGHSLDQTHFMQRQILYLVLGFAVFFAVSRIPLDFWRKWGAKILIVAFLLCLFLSILGFMNSSLAVCTLGACRWYNLGGLGTFQPAEFLKFGLVIFCAGFLATRAAKNKLDSVRQTLLPLAIVVGLSLFVIVILQKDLGTGVALVSITLAQLIISGARWRTIGVAFAGVAAAAVASIIIAPHRIARVLTFIGSDSSTESASYHINQSLIALGSGGFFGKGLGQSVQAFGWLPEAVNDSIFAILGESFGFVGLVAILTAFFALLFRVLRMADYLENMFLRLFVAGVFGWLSAHLIINVGAMIGVLPLTGITLPLLSFGGTSMVFIMAGLGAVFAISRYTSHRKLKQEQRTTTSESSQRRRGVGRTRYAGRRGY